MCLRKTSKDASELPGDSKCSSLNGGAYPGGGHQVVENSIYSRICQWFNTLNKKVN